MRKSLTTAMVGAVAVAAGATAVHATGAATQHLEAGIAPSKAGTAKKPKPVKLQLHLFATTSDGSVPPTANHVVIFMPRGLIFQGAKFKSCSLAVVSDPNRGPTKCPSGSKIGGGTAKAHIGSDPAGPDEELTVTVFNGPKGKSTVIYVHGTTPAQVDGAFESKLKPIRSGPYAMKLDTTIPQQLYEPAPGLFTPLTDFRVAIKAITRVKGKQYGVVASTSCPKSKRWPFKATWDYANAAGQDNANTQVICSR